MLKQFIFNLPNVRNPTSLFYVFIQTDIFYLSQILSLIELPPFACEFRCEIWGPKGTWPWYTTLDCINMGEIHNNANEIEKFQCELLFQGEDSIAEYYSKIKKSNDTVKLCEGHLKRVFCRGLTSENQNIYFNLNSRLEYSLNEIVEILIQIEKQNKALYFN